MTASSYLKVVALLALSYSTASAQVSSTAPKRWKSASPIGLDASDFMYDHNLRETVRREVSDTNTVRLIATSVGLTDHEQTLFQIAPGPVEEELWFYRLGDE